MAPARKGKLQSPWHLYWEFRLQAVRNSLRFQRTLLEERSRWLKEWEERASTAAEEIEEDAEEQEEEEEERQPRRSSRSRSKASDNPRG